MKFFPASVFPALKHLSGEASTRMSSCPPQPHQQPPQSLVVCRCIPTHSLRSQRPSCLRCCRCFRTRTPRLGTSIIFPSIRSLSHCDLFMRVPCYGHDNSSLKHIKHHVFHHILTYHLLPHSIAALTALTALLLPPSTLTDDQSPSTLSFPSLAPLSLISPSLQLPLPPSLSPLLAAVAALTADHNNSVANAAMNAAAAITAGFIVSNAKSGSQATCAHKNTTKSTQPESSQNHASPSTSLPASLTTLDTDIATLLLSVLANTMTPSAHTALACLHSFALSTVNSLVSRDICPCCVLPEPHVYRDIPLTTIVDKNNESSHHPTFVPLALPSELVSPLPKEIPLPTTLLLPALMPALVTGTCHIHD